jgi:hypothetical protein
LANSACARISTHADQDISRLAPHQAKHLDVSEHVQRSGAQLAQRRGQYRPGHQLTQRPALPQPRREVGFQSLQHRLRIELVVPSLVRPLRLVLVHLFASYPACTIK